MRAGDLLTLLSWQGSWKRIVIGTCIVSLSLNLAILVSFHSKQTTAKQFEADKRLLRQALLSSDSLTERLSSIAGEISVIQQSAHQLATANSSLWVMATNKTYSSSIPLASELSKLRGKAAASDIFSTQEEITTGRTSLNSIIETGRTAVAEIGMSESRNSEEIRALEDSKQSSIAEAPVYNALFEGPQGIYTDTLPDQLPVTVRFFIAQPHIGNAIPVSDWTVKPEILAALRAQPMQVAISCFACESPTMQTTSITYSREIGGSSEARFQIVPSSKLARPSDGFFQVSFDVFSKGVEYDHLVVGLYVGSFANSAKSLVVPRPPIMPESSHLGPPSARPDGAREPDLELQFTRSGDGRLLVAVQPINPQLQSYLQQAGVGFTGIHRFTVGLPDLRNLARETYISLRRIFEPHSELWLRISQGKSADPSIHPSQFGLNLNNADENKILAAMYNFGAGIYTNIFDAAQEQSLSKVMRAFDKFQIPGRPVRIRILTDKETEIPWQLVHPPGKIDPNKFWGFKYELSVLPSFAGSGRLDGTLTYVPGDKALFAGYRGVPNVDADVQVAGYGEILADHLKSSFGQPIDFKLVNSRQDLLNNLKVLRSDVWFIGVYAHSSTGISASTAEGGAVVLGDDKEGPRLLFAPSESVFATDIDELRWDPEIAEAIGASRMPVFSKRPLVFLDACETGTSARFIIDDPDVGGTAGGFPEALLNTGARGVIVSESKVWDEFALIFGQELVTKMLAGEEIAAALLEARLKYLNSAKNPMGLLYSYYGNPDVRIVHKH